ncbi:MAG: hypothetical protein C6P37_01820 [Caldibacillus debilis]|uniref:Uncharacterized protein n=1 Tax=Caldibacillus debilis TaxID=301148 RepID=A0A3E0K7R1_9BACI|nr:hypothetical protein [Bacillaceae bacterium]MBY6273595.1 hypothetical protein [Bacillaceae bacterium]REJ18785.1 MAG: hypothetical protein C6W57_02735 [Caldibacillus debilis]REJ27280.1 MAG: hypothetical protein C6W56_10790 [Caldibacillus debilis]REJ31097.1 MAG: hypothetical protein C6P37_01820 [Caldibacillus debilis]
MTAKMVFLGQRRSGQLERTVLNDGRNGFYAQPRRSDESSSGAERPPSPRSGPDLRDAIPTIE